jgi:outer membrane protein TolC
MTWKVVLSVAALAVASRASAVQPLEEFLRGARSGSADNAEARAVRRQTGAEATAALGRALPGITLQGTYTRNEFETAIPFPDGAGGTTSVTLTPEEQLDGVALLDVPLIDLSSFARIAAARTASKASAAQEDATALGVESVVSQQYHQLVANLALVESARSAVDVARASLRTAEERHRAGAVSILDVERARGEVERNVQLLAAAELGVSLVAKALESSSGVKPALDGAPELADDLHEEPPLERFQVADERIPALDAAILGRVASEQQARAQRLSLVPSLGAAVAERVTSAEGLGGEDDSWQAVVALTWRFDLTTLAGIRAQDAAADAARARELRARLAARDAIHDAWQTVRTNIARSRSARVRAEVSARAAELALRRYQAGEATQLDLLQAQRDAFAADAARIQTDAELLDSRRQLRLAAGWSLLEPDASAASSGAAARPQDLLARVPQASAGTDSTEEPQ